MVISLCAMFRFSLVVRRKCVAISISHKITTKKTRAKKKNSIFRVQMSLHAFLCRSVPIILKESSSQFLHKGHIKPDNFEGLLACGGCCYMLHYYLDVHYGIQTKMMRKVSGRKDHCYLQKGTIIFDPTYRQFISQDRWLPSYLYIGSSQWLEEYCGRPFWLSAVESPEVMDAGRVLRDPSYAEKRGPHFQRLYEEMKN